MSTRFPGRRLSPLRLAVLVLIMAAIAYSGLFTAQTVQDTRTAEGSRPWFGAYVDATASPTFPFESPRHDSEKNVVLSFIVASEDDTCEASWGGYHTLPRAQDAMEFDRRLVRLRQFHGEVVISFGGEANSELALACDTDGLTNQYRAVLERYRPSAIDLDIEGEALSDPASRQRRVEAITRLQTEPETSVPVWLTLPVGVHGLTPDGVEVVAEFLAAGAAIAGVNGMAMNFTHVKKDSPLTEPVIDAAEALHRQLKAIYADHDQSIGDRTLWRRIGITPMIGQNDVADEVFTPEDARAINEFALEVGIGRISLWSANRDRPCAEAYADLSVVSESCSGVPQGEESYRAVLGEGFTGSPDGDAPGERTGPALHPEEITDDPKTSPYPIWEEDPVYPAGSRVVWRSNVYVARWWNTGMQPDDPTVPSSAAPWQLLGPVLHGEKPFEPLTLPEGYYPEWDPLTQYEEGDRVLFERIAYEAKWWSANDNPASGQSDPASTPWKRVAEEEVEELLKE